MNGCAEFRRYDTSITLLKWKGFVIEKSPSIQKTTSKIIPVCMHLSNLYDRDLNVISSSFSDFIDMTFRRFLAVGEINGGIIPARFTCIYALDDLCVTHYIANLRFILGAVNGDKKNGFQPFTYRPLFLLFHYN